MPPSAAVLTRNVRSLDPGARCARRCARRDSDPQPPGPRPGASTYWATSTWSRHPVPTRVTRCTRAGPQPCAAAKLAILASNQETPGSGPGGSAKFPQWPSGAEGAIRTHKPRGLSSRGLPGCRHSRIVRHLGLEPRPDTGSACLLTCDRLGSTVLFVFDAAARRQGTGLEPASPLVGMDGFEPPVL